MTGEWIQQVTESTHTAGALAAAFILGIIGVITSCCNVAVFSAVVGFSGSVSVRSRKKTILLTSMVFLAGIIFTLAVIGAAMSLISGLISQNMGYYWKIAAAAVFILFGLHSLNMLPFRIPSVRIGTGKTGEGLLSSLVFGLVLAGATTACNALCNPAFLMVISSSFLQHDLLWGAGILLSFGLGYGLPLAAAMAGIGLGLSSLTARTEKISKVVQYAAGILLLVIGFYFLFTL